MDSVHNPPSSFSSRRPAAGSLPTFSLPPPQSEVPSMDEHSSRPRSFYNIKSIDLTPPSAGASEGLSPGLSSVHTSSSQGSQAPSTMQQYTYNHVHGTWPTPGNPSYGVNSATGQQAAPMQTPGGSSYTVNAANGAQHPLGTAAYAPRSIYGQPYGTQRSPQSPTGAGEASYDHHPFQSSNGQESHSSLPSGSITQAPTLSGAPAHAEPYGHSRSSISGPSYSSSSTGQPQAGFSYATQHSPSSHSPTGAAPIPRGLGQHSLPSMAPPGSYRPYPTYQPPMPTMGGPVMSNIHQPGSQLSMISGMVPTGYGPPPTAMMYQHAQPQSQPERPFKCDQCVQSFSRNHDLKRHKRIHLAVKPFPCTYCAKSFSRKDALKRHRLVKGCENKSHEASNENPSASDDGVQRNGEAG
ncbi:hypothetical protein V8C42DRAFT_339814 [Trichoderma barbatum]